MKWIILVILPVAIGCLTKRQARSTTLKEVPAEVAPQVGPVLSRGLAYLDGRAAEWTARVWDNVQTEDRTCALSCHTTLPYAMARGAMPAVGAESPAVATLKQKISGRVAGWASARPYYDFNPQQSRATEAATLFIAQSLLEGGASAPSPVLQTALSHAYALQGDGGDWNWMDEELAPFESAQDHYWGTALVTYALASVPGTYQHASIYGDAVKPRVVKLVQYLREKIATQPLHAQLMALRATARMPGILDAATIASIRSKATALQKADGSWSLASLGEWKTKEGVLNDGAALPGDGYATGLVSMALLESGTAATDPALQRSLTWLLTNQDARGAWPARSLNSPTAQWNNSIITDASTAYAVMATYALVRANNGTVCAACAERRRFCGVVNAGAWVTGRWEACQ